VFRELQYALITADYATAGEILAKLEGVERHDDPWLLLGQALVSQHGGSEKLPGQYFNKLERNPFFEKGILKAANYYHNIPGDEFRAYNTLLGALEVNEYSVRLLKAYGIQCARLNLDTYRDSTLERLQELLTSEEYQAYRSELTEIEELTVGDFGFLELE
jgi:hypothetical protein